MEDLKSDSSTSPSLRKRDLSSNKATQGQLKGIEEIAHQVTPPKAYEEDQDTQNAVVYQQIALTRIKSHAVVCIQKFSLLKWFKSV